MMNISAEFAAELAALKNDQEVGELYGDGADRLLEWLGIDRTTKKDISEVTYFTCLKLLSETMGKIPLKYYKSTEQGRIRAAPTEMTGLLSVRPNPIMTPTTMWSTTEQNTQHYGNGYIWMRRVFYRPPGGYGGYYTATTTREVERHTSSNPKRYSTSRRPSHGTGSWACRSGRSLRRASAEP